MTNSKYDLIIVGGGPIGSIIAYFVSNKKDELGFKNIALLQKEPETYEGIAYPYAGGSVRWFFEDEEMSMITKKTADFIFSIKDKIDLNLIEDSYFFVHKVVEYLKSESQKNGLEIFSNNEFKEFKKDGDLYKVITDKNEYLTQRIFFALGYKNKEIFILPLEVEKRQLFVLDLEVDEKRLKLPHTILKFKEGIVYFFVKKFDDGYKIVLGQEDLMEHNDKYEPEDYFEKLLSMGLVDFLPFLKQAKVEKILWGFDVKNKKPLFYKIDENVYTVNCGSATRSIIHIGEKSLELLK
jgi:glycine/D-amino acid oxidase-like deaminating enzyme